MSVEILAKSGKVDIVAEDRTDVEAAAEKVHTESDGTVVAESKSGRVRVACPVGTNVRIGVGSGRVVTRGTLGDVRITSGSGRVEIDHVASADVRSASGSVTIAGCDGECRVVVSSGSMEIGPAGHLDATAKSGTLRVGPVGGGTIHLGSGNATIDATGTGDLAIEAHSGSVSVTLPKGVRPHCDVDVKSGAFRCEPATGDDCRITVRAWSGNVVVRERGSQS